MMGLSPRTLTAWLVTSGCGEDPLDDSNMGTHLPGFPFFSRLYLIIANTQPSPIIDPHVISSLKQVSMWRAMKQPPTSKWIACRICRCVECLIKYVSPLISLKIVLCLNLLDFLFFIFYFTTTWLFELTRVLSKLIYTLINQSNYVSEFTIFWYKI